MIFKTINHWLLVIALGTLTGCFGGSIAQQIARSIATKVADKAVANVLDVDEDASPRPAQNAELKGRAPDDVWFAFTTAGFRTVDPNAEVLPIAHPDEEPIQVLQANSLVRVELFNLLIGEEKIAVFENARLVGALNLPHQREWRRWNVATGVTENNRKLITFLIPPEFGKMPSGTLAVVELADIGDLNIARYRLN
ncbi:MAG: hypothetical protein ACT4OH_08800 [Methylophilaceae bacterium]